MSQQEKLEEIKVRIGFGGQVVRTKRGKFTFQVLVDLEGVMFEVVPPKDGWPEFPNGDGALSLLRKLHPKFVAGNMGAYDIVPFFGEVKT